MALSTEKQKALRGELHFAFTPDLLRERRRCTHACQRLNNAGEVPRRRLVELWKDINGDPRPLPPQLDNPDLDEALFQDWPYIDLPFRADYGTNIRLGSNVYINSYAVFIDTCIISIGSRTLLGPNVSIYSGSHPLDPALRNGTRGPEDGAEVHIGEDCWIGGGAIILPGVRVGKGSTVGAGSVVTKDVPPFHVVAGNPARIIRRIATTMDPQQNVEAVSAAFDEYNGMPPPSQGVFVDFKAALDHCQAHARLHGYGCVISSNNKGRGIAYIQCHQGGKYRNNWGVTDETRKRKRKRRTNECHWKARVQRKDEGWVLVILEGHHNHGPSPDGRPVRGTPANDSSVVGLSVHESSSSGMSSTDLPSEASAAADLSMNGQSVRDLMVNGNSLNSPPITQLHAVIDPGLR